MIWKEGRSKTSNKYMVARSGTSTKLAMDISLSFPQILASFIFLFFLLWVSRGILTRNSGKKKPPPEAGGAWPIIGHLHRLGGPEPPHIVLADMADKYGSIFTIKMGVHRALVVSNWEMAKECFTTNDKEFASRPKYLAAELLGYGSAMFAFSPYGHYWRQVRKIAMLELLSNHRLEMLKGVREAEVRKSVKEMYRAWERNRSSGRNGVLVEMKRWFGDITLNVILKVIAGKAVGYMGTEEGEKNEKLKNALREFFDLSGRFVVADGLPFLRWLDIGGHEMAMKRTAKELDTVAEEWLREHKERRDSGIVKDSEEDFMDLLLKILGDDAEVAFGRDADTITKATSLVNIPSAA